MQTKVCCAALQASLDVMSLQKCSCTAMTPRQIPLVSTDLGILACRGSGRLADVLDVTMMQHIPLEDLHADAAAQLKDFDHIVVLPMLRDDRRAWQAWVRLSKVFRLKQVAVLSV